MEMPLLLSPPDRVVIKDAARAVKRLDSLTIQEVTIGTLSDLLGLPGMRVTRFAIEHQGEEQYFTCSVSISMMWPYVRAARK